MIALDSNVVLRLAVNDDPAQAERARRLLAAAVADGQSIFLSLAVVLESVWALRKTYKRPKAEILGFLDGLLTNVAIVLSDRSLIAGAARLYAGRPVDFADCIIAERARVEGATLGYSFENAGVRAGLFTPVG